MRETTAGRTYNVSPGPYYKLGYKIAGGVIRALVGMVLGVTIQQALGLAGIVAIIGAVPVFAGLIINTMVATELAQAIYPFTLSAVGGLVAAMLRLTFTETIATGVTPSGAPVGIAAATVVGVRIVDRIEDGRVFGRGSFVWFLGFGGSGGCGFSVCV